MGQCLPQPDQRADPCHPRRDLLRSGNARAVEGDHAGDPDDRRNLRRQIPRRCRAADRRRAQGRRAQDLDAAGPRTRPPDGDRSVGDRGSGDGTPDADPDAGAATRCWRWWCSARRSPACTRAMSTLPKRKPTPLHDRVVSMTNWIRFRHQGQTGFGTLTPSGIAVHHGEMFGVAKPSGQQLALGDVELLAPAAPSKIVALWNNFHALAAKLNMPEPAEPLYLLKAPTSVTAPGAVIKRPSAPTAARPPMRANSASSSARRAARCRLTRLMNSSSAIPASTTSPPTTFSTAIRPFRNGRGPRALTAPGRSVPSSPPASIPRTSWCAPSSTARNARTIPLPT